MNSQLTGEEVSSAFSRFYGSMDIIPFLGDNFNRIFPIFILVLAVFQVRTNRQSRQTNKQTNKQTNNTNGWTDVSCAFVIDRVHAWLAAFV